MTATYAQHTHAGASLDSIRVAEAMHRGVVTCRPETSLHTVATLMAAHRIHAVVVAPCSDGEEWGLVSDIDLVAAAAAGSVGGLSVGQVASSPSVFVRPDDSIGRAVQLMREYQTHHVIVLGRSDDRPVGIVSTLDVADVVAELPRPRSVT